MRLQPTVTACLLAALTLLLYAFRLTAPPISPDEAAFNARAATVRPGTTPLFFRVNGDRWLQPAAVYANAAVGTAGGDDQSGRFASAVFGAADVALVFLIAHLLSGRVWIGMIAAVVLMLTPAHWLLAQRGTDAIFPAPLVLLWLWNLVRFLKWDAMRSLAGAAAALGASLYVHPAGPMTAAFLWLLTLAVARRRNRVRLAAATLVFGAAWLPAAWWFFRYPDTYPQTFGQWLILAPHIRVPLAGLQAFINPNTLGTRTSLYWGFWDPSWLFFSTNGTAAPLLLVALPLIALGLLHCAGRIHRETGIIVIVTALVVPLAGATFGVPHYMADAAAVLPILALVAALGVDYLVELVNRRRALKDDEHPAAPDGWDSDPLMPRT